MLFVSYFIFLHTPDSLFTLTFLHQQTQNSPRLQKKTKKKPHSNFILCLDPSLTHVSHHHFISHFRPFPVSLLSLNLSLTHLFSTFSTCRPHLGVRFDHPEVWRKEPPSSQISYGALLQAWHVYQAESTTHPLQPPARDRWEEDQR